MSDFLISYFDKVFNVFKKLKSRQWSNKERSLVQDEIIIIVISGILAYFIVAFTPVPEGRVDIRQYTFEAFKALLPGLDSFVRFFSAIGKFFSNISATLHRILGPFWDAIIFIPSNLIGLLQFIIICLITFLKNIIEILYNFFSMILSPFQFVLNILSSIGNLFNRFISFLMKIPGISHLIRLINLIIHDIVILLSSFFALFTEFGKIFRSFDLRDFILNLKNFKLFNIIGSFFSFILRFFEWLFKVTIGRLLGIFNINLDNFLVNIGYYIGNFFKFFFDHFLNIPKLFEKISLALGKLKVNFRGAEALVNLLIGLLNIIKWILFFPFFLILRFLSFFSFILRSLTLDRITKWWNNLCQQPCGCQEAQYNNLMEKIESLEKLIKDMRENYNNATNTAN